MVVAACSRILPFGAYLAFLALAPVIAAQPVENAAGVDLRWLYGLKVAVVFMVLANLWPRFVELVDAPRVRRSHWLSAVAAGVAVFLVWINLDFGWAKLGQLPGFDPRDAAGSIDWPLVATRIFGAAVVVPVMEELFWRSFVMRWCGSADFLALAPGAVSVRALLISSLLFGLEHQLWLAGIVAGLVYGLLYKRSGNLWVAVAAHATTNALLGIWVVYTERWEFW